MNRNTWRQLRDSVMIIVSRPITLGAFLIAARLSSLFTEMSMKYDGKWYIFIGRKFWGRNDRKFQASHVPKDLWFWS